MAPKTVFSLHSHEKYIKLQSGQLKNSAPLFRKVFKNESCDNVDNDILIFRYMEKSGSACYHEVSLTTVKSHPC